MTQASSLVMWVFLVLGETAGGAPLEFRVVDAETGEELPAVKVRELPPTWEFRFVLQKPKPLGLAGRYTNLSGVVQCESVSRGTYFFETDGYVPVDVRKNWFGMKVFEEPYKHGTDLKPTDGVYVIPLRRKDGP